MIRVLVNGAGTIGKRIAHAVKLQDDMELVGISDVAPTTVLKNLLDPSGPLHGVRLYGSTPEGVESLKKGGLEVAGLLEDILKDGKVDVIIDATPAGIGAKNKGVYERYGVKALFQGGEKADVAEMTFNSVVNYEEAVGKRFVRVPSCNTTGLVRTLSAIDSKVGVEYAFIALARRAADPWEYKKGPINSVNLSKVPSHHAPDLQTVLKHIRAFSMAIVVPTTLAHTHILEVETKKEATREEIMEAFEKQTRVILLDMEEYPATSLIIEKFRDYGRPRYDMYEIAVLKDSIHVEGRKVRWFQVVHQEADIVPENIDAIRAITGIEKDKWKSIEKTNRSLGIIK
jgi:glyceraldehyde-3-phosphate dehydrogenase (NAD(P))